MGYHNVLTVIDHLWTNINQFVLLVFNNSVVKHDRTDRTIHEIMFSSCFGLRKLTHFCLT